MKRVIFLKGQLLQCLYPKKDHEQSKHKVEDEQLDSFTRSSCSGEVTENLELGEMQDPNKRLNIFTDDCNKESSVTDADVTSIVVDDVYESKAQDRPESTKTSMLESEVCSLRTDFSHLTSTVENMKAEIVELQKSKLSSTVKLTEVKLTFNMKTPQHQLVISMMMNLPFKMQRYSRHTGELSRDAIDKGGFNNNLQSLHSKKHDDAFLSYWKCFTCRNVFG